MQWGAMPGTVTVSLKGQDWQVDSTGKLYPEPQVLTWHSLIVPATAKGPAVLTVTAPDGKSLLLGEYDVNPSDHVFVQPATANPISADFVGVGTLVGADVTSPNGSKVTLIWKADGTSAISYTVFVHLLDNNGQVIAQSDALPANGSRPTTSWVAGEYVVDLHELTFSKPDYRGPATIEVGLYDAASMNRVKLANGSDHVVLPMTINIQ
jgi:hypothetical protein